PGVVARLNATGRQIDHALHHEPVAERLVGDLYRVLAVANAGVARRVFEPITARKADLELDFTLHGIANQERRLAGRQHGELAESRHEGRRNDQLATARLRE